MAKPSEYTRKYAFVNSDFGLNSRLGDDTPTLMFPTGAPGKELIDLLSQVVNSIAHYTDYPMVAGVLLPEPLIPQPQLVVSSKGVPESVKNFLSEAAFPVKQLKKVMEKSVNIQIEELGFACYFPPTHYRYLKDMLTVFRAFDEGYRETERAAETDQLDAPKYWHKGDGLISPIMNRRGQLFGFILLGAPRTGLAPTPAAILPILAFASQIAQAVEHLRNDTVLVKINDELCLEKDRLKTIFNMSAHISEAEGLDAKLEILLQGITDIGWQRTSVYLYDEVLGLESSRHTASALRAGILLSDQMTPERRREVFRTLGERWTYEECYYLRYLDSEAQPIIEEFFQGTWLMTSHKQNAKHSDRWHPYDLLLAPLRARGGRLIGIIHVADPIDGRRPSVEDCTILQLFAHESALIVEQASLYQEKAQLYEREQQHIIELKEANEKLQELERIRQEFTATLVHDIRSPMTVVLGTLELLLMYAQKKPEQKFNPNTITLIDNANVTCKQIVTLINELLDLSKIQHSGLQLYKTSVNPQDIITSVVDECDALAIGKQISVNFGCSIDLQPMMVDRNYIHRALVNLLSNAIKYTPKGGQIWFEARCVEGNLIGNANSYIMFTVIDSGPGIPEEDVPYLFDPYYQASNRKGQIGTGLGLAIVKRIANAHGGSVLVKSQVDVGSSFSLLLPMERPEPQAETAPAEPTPDPAVSDSAAIVERTLEPAEIKGLAIRENLEQNHSTDVQASEEASIKDQPRE